MEQQNTPTKAFIRVAVPENICLPCSATVGNPALRRELFSGPNKTKIGASSWRRVWSRAQLRENEMGIVCRNCSERNETLTKNFFKVRENFFWTKGML